MRDPIPFDRRLLLVLLQSQFADLAIFLVKPPAFEKAMLKSIDGLSIPELRALALDNALKLLRLLRDPSRRFLINQRK